MTRAALISALLFLVCGTQARADENGVTLFLATAENDTLSVVFEPEYSFKRSVHGLDVEAGGSGSLELAGTGPLIGDALVESQAKLTSTLLSGATLTVDGSHVLDRDYEAAFSPTFAAIDTVHTLNGNITFEKTFAAFRMTLDAGATSVLYQDLDRIGFGTFDRATQDHIDPEVAARFAYMPDETVSPFVELAYVGRHYFKPHDAAGRVRDFAGPEFIAGVERNGAKFSGQFATIYAWRDHAAAGVADRAVFGPYIDLTWKPDENTELIFAIASSLAQESSGDVSVYPVHSAHMEMTSTLTDDLRLGTTFDLKYEDFAGAGGTLTLTPEITATWSLRNNLAFVASVGGEWSKSPATAARFDFSAKAGVRVSLH